MDISKDPQIEHAITVLKRNERSLSAKQRSKIAQLVAGQGVKRKSTKRKTPKRKTRWWHKPGEKRPPEFAYGPLVGIGGYLSEAIIPMGGNKRRSRPERRQLISWGKDGLIWVVCRSSSAQYCLVWFTTAAQYMEAQSLYNKLTATALPSA